MTEVSANYTKERYSKEDFLAISPEYKTENEEVFSEYKRKITLSYTCMGISFGLLFLFIILLFFDPPVFGILAIIMMILGIVSAICASTNISKRVKALADLGDKHYRNYVAEFNNQKERV